MHVDKQNNIINTGDHGDVYTSCIGTVYSCIPYTSIVKNYNNNGFDDDGLAAVFTPHVVFGAAASGCITVYYGLYGLGLQCDAQIMCSIIIISVDH